MTLLANVIAELQSNKEQWEAFEATGDCVVLAPPGSGKTKLLTARLVWDLRHSIQEPHGAACITYTNAAAGELTRRITTLGAPRRSNLFVGTVHSWARRHIVSPYATLAGRPFIARAPIAPEARRTALYRVAEDEFYEQHEERTGVKNTVELRRKHLNYDPADVAMGGERTVQVALRWQSLLEEHGLIDFDDIVRHAVELVEQHEWIRRALAARFPRLYLDEYQDLAPGLDRLARKLCFDEAVDADLFAVGDPDQSIMGFNGSRPELLRELAGLDRVTCIRLRTNYRSRSVIVEGALRALGETRDIDWLDEGGEINRHRCPEGPTQQLVHAVERVIEERESGTRLDQMAILVPNKWLKADVVGALAEADLPVFVRSDAYRETPTTSLVEALATWATQPRGASGFRLGDLLSRWRAIMGRTSSLPMEAALVRALQERAPTDRAGPFVAEIAALGLAARLKRTQRDDELEQLTAMAEALLTGELSRLTLEGLGRMGHAPGQVHVSTIHAGKGLEFDVVLVLGLDEGVFPHKRATSRSEIAEAKRAFYVSLTRARRRVDLVYSGFRITSGGWRFDDGPCRFLSELD